MKALFKILFVVLSITCILLVLSGCCWQSYQEYIDEAHSDNENENNAVELDSSKLYSEWLTYDYNSELLSEVDFLSGWSQTAICRELYVYSVLGTLDSSKIAAVEEDRYGDDSYIKVETEANEIVYFWIQQYKTGAGYLIAVWKDSPDSNGMLLFSSLSD